MEYKTSRMEVVYKEYPRDAILKEYWDREFKRRELEKESQRLRDIEADNKRRVEKQEKRIKREAKKAITCPFCKMVKEPEEETCKRLSCVTKYFDAKDMDEYYADRARNFTYYNDNIDDHNRSRRKL